jgi:hypothetical protein
LLICSRPWVRSGFAVGGDHALVDPPGHLDLDVGIGGEQVVQSVLLLVGEQVGAGVQSSARAVEGVVLAATVPVDVLLDPAPALVQGVPGQAHDVERIHHCDRVGKFLGGGGLEPGEPVHRDHLHPVAPGLLAFGEPLLERPQLAIAALVISGTAHCGS